MKHIILTPGGMGFYALLGYLTKIEKELDDLEEISGASAGAILGFLLTSGKSLNEILDMTLHIDFEELTKFNLKTFINSFGFIDHELIKQKFQELWGGNPTFKELSKKLYVSAYCLNTMTNVYFSRDTHPDMYVIDAVCASMAVPVLFAAFEYNGQKYVDGSMTECIPTYPFLNKNFSDVLCVRLVHKQKKTMKVDNLLDYFTCIALTAYNYRQTDDSVPNKILDISNYNILDFKATLEVRLSLFMLGYGA